jgi:hypothetical protein
MTIILFCVFGINVNSTGVVKKATISVDQRMYQTLKYDDPWSEAVHKLCHHVFHKKPDLAWFTD